MALNIWRTIAIVVSAIFFVLGIALYAGEGYGKNLYTIPLAMTLIFTPVVLLGLHEVSMGMRPGRIRVEYVLAYGVSACILLVLVLGVLMDSVTPEELDRYENKRVEKLMIACGKGNLAYINTYAASGASLNVSGRRGTNPLGVAVKYGRMDVLSRLLELGADPNWERTLVLQTSAVHAAIGCSGTGDINCEMKTEMLRLLLDHGLNPNLLVRDESILRMALRAGCESQVLLLIGYGATIHDAEGRKESAFRVALMHDRWSMARVLLDTVTSEEAVAILRELPKRPGMGDERDVRRELVSIASRSREAVQESPPQSAPSQEIDKVNPR